MKVSVIIPTLNEVNNVAKVIEEARKFSDEIILIDGHSTDGTIELIKSLNITPILLDKKGKGFALRKGIAIAKGEILVFLDADQSHDPKDIPRLIAPITNGTADHVSGSRLTGGSDELAGNISNFIRLWGNSIITICINARFKTKLTDSQNGFRAIKAEVARSLNLKENITTIEQEMIIKSLMAGHRMVEVPTHEFKRNDGESKISVPAVSFRYVYSLFKYLFLSLFLSSNKVRFNESR